MVLIIVAMAIGMSWALIMSKYIIRATPGGMKKKLMFSMRKSHVRRMFCCFTKPKWSDSVRRSMPMMLEGIFVPVR